MRFSRGSGPSRRRTISPSDSMDSSVRFGIQGSRRIRSLAPKLSSGVVIADNGEDGVATGFPFRRMYRRAAARSAARYSGVRSSSEISSPMRGSVFCRELGPASMRYPSLWTDRIAPPGWSRASQTWTLCPRLTSVHARVSPLIPAPIMRVFMREGKGEWDGMGCCPQVALYKIRQ